MSRVRELIRPSVRGLKPYYKAPLDGNPLRLDQNTNLYGANPAVTADVPAMDQYPSRDSDELMDALGDWHGLSPDHFIAGNGSDEILDILTKTFGGKGRVFATCWPTYSLYPFYASLQDMTFVEARDAEALIEANADLTIIANPNNPQGTMISDDEIERLLQGGIVVLDEAYIEYAGLSKSWIDRVNAYENLLVMRTFSKAYGLAGLRVGYLAGNPELIQQLRLVKPPFNLNRYSERVAANALAQQAWVDNVVKETIVERDRLTEALAARGFKVTPSHANFVLTTHALDPAVIADGLRARGILVRTFGGKAGLEQCVRFGIGTAQHTDQLLAALDEVLA